MKNVNSSLHAEAEAAAKLTGFLRREFGLPDCVARAELRRGVLAVLFQDALSPIGRVLAQSEEGRQAIGSVYRILHEANRERMHALVSRIVGFPVRRSHLETDTAAGRVLLTFQWEELMMAMLPEPCPKAVSRPDWAEGAAWDVSGVDLWRKAAEADYHLCRAFARDFGARLTCSLRCQRVGWETDKGQTFALVLPNAQFQSYVRDDEWRLYHVESDTVLHRTAAERERLQMLLLPDCADDWAALLNGALQDSVCATRYTVAPHHVNIWGDVDAEPTGFVFAIAACVPPGAVSVAPLQVSGQGRTPEEAARAAALHFLRERLPELVL